MIVVTLGLLRKPARDDIIFDLRRFAKRIGVVNLRDIRQYLGPRFGLTPDEIATILKQAVREGLLKPARPRVQCWYAPQRRGKKKEGVT